MKNSNEPFTSGHHCAGLIHDQGPAGLLVKMCLESARWQSTLCALYWKESVLKSGRLLFKLLVRTSKKNGLGLLPTPTANDYKNASCPPSQKKRNSIPGLIATVSSGAYLNPCFLEQMMGFPKNWTQLSDMEMQCVRHSRRRAAKDQHNQN